MAKVLWFTTKNFSEAQKYMVSSFVQRVGLPQSEITFVNIFTRVSNALAKKGQKGWKYNAEAREAVLAQIDDYIRLVQPEVLVINDGITLSHLLDDESSIFLWRGGVFKYKEYRCYVMDDFLQLKSVLHATWQFANDVKKIVRFLEKDTRPQPKFQYEVVKDRYHAIRVSNTLAECIILSADIETAGEPRFITAIGYSGLHPDGQIYSFVFPFYNPTQENNCHWESADEEESIWRTIGIINNNDVPKVMQNGAYDCAYFLKYRVPPRNYFLDTLHLFHSIWPEAPKKLNYIASIALDIVHYWKDDIKGTADDNESKSRVPASVEGYGIYLRYNALDCYNTLLSCRWLINIINQPALEWATRNYVLEFSDMVGPAFMMSMTGMKGDRQRQNYFFEKWLQEGDDAKARLRTMVDDPDFNPNSPTQVGSLLYDVLGAPIVKRRGVAAKKTKTDKPVGEDVLKMVRVRHPLYAMYIDAIWDSKKPFNNASKYGNMPFYNGRFIYSLSPLTKTGRYSSKSHHFGYGTNAQNIQKKNRAMFVADPGYVMFNADYSAADTWFIAHEAQMEKMIALLNSDKDTHCEHASLFFSKDYDLIAQGYREKASWVVDPLKGVRQNTKRISHGAHYQEAGATVYMTMGHDECVASALAVGYSDAGSWNPERLMAFCSAMLEKYYENYPELKPWFASSVDDVVAAGNRATCYGGRTHLFFGNLRDNKSQQRFLSAFYGQGGTSGIIRRALLDIYYKSDLFKQGLILLTQTHDSITGQVPEKKLHIIKNILTIMEEPVTLKDKTFTVPVDLEVGRTWDNGMVPWKEGMELAEIDAAEAKVAAGFQMQEAAE